MEIKSVYDLTFSPYGRVLEEYDFSELLETLTKTSKRPINSVVYEPSDSTLEALAVCAQLRDNLYGGMPVQIGYCNGVNKKLGCLEYHRGSEINVAANDVVLLVAPLHRIENNRLSTEEVKAFLLPAGSAVQLYETTLHYAPCKSPTEDGFRVAIILPKGTNTVKPDIVVQSQEDKLLWACNKWLLAHPDAAEAAQGAYVGLVGANISIQ